MPPVVELPELFLAGEQVRAPEQERQLGQLGGLERDRADLQVPGGAARFHPDQRDQQQAHDGDEHQRVGGGAEQPGRGAGRQPHAGQAQQHPHQLVLEAGVGRGALRELGDRRGGQHHHQPEREQQGGDAEDEVVGRQRPVQGGDQARELAAGGRRRLRRAPGGGHAGAAWPGRLLDMLHPSILRADRRLRRDLGRVSREQITPGTGVTWASTPRRRCRGRAPRTARR